MPRILSKTTVDLVPGAVTRAPLGNLSCPYSSWDVLRQPDQNPGSDHYWNPPTSESQYARQRILAVIVAFILAAILAQAGW